MNEIAIDDFKVKFLGPTIEEGYLPAIFYFALSAEDTLLLDPFNQPIKKINLKKVRVFSIDLPDHAQPKSPHEAIGSWIDSLIADDQYLNFFYQKVVHIINNLIDLGYFKISQLSLVGLSRGSFVALHVASRIKHPITVLGFSPLINLSLTKEAIERNFSNTSHDLYHVLARLADKKIRLYIGNRDKRTNSAACAKFVFDLAETAYDQGIRNPPFELFVFPSIGYMGHGTPKHIFEEGTEFLTQVMKIYE